MSLPPIQSWGAAANSAAGTDAKYGLGPRRCCNNGEAPPLAKEYVAILGDYPEDSVATSKDRARMTTEDDESSASRRGIWRVGEDGGGTRELQQHGGTCRELR